MRFLVICLLVGAGYWYYSGMYQQSAHPDYQQKLIKNAENMRECMKRKEYAARRTLTNAGELEEIARGVIESNPDQVEQYRAGQEKLFNFFVGQIMKATRGKASPEAVQEVLRQLLDR